MNLRTAGVSRCRVEKATVVGAELGPLRLSRRIGALAIMLGQLVLPGATIALCHTAGQAGVCTVLLDQVATAEAFRTGCSFQLCCNSGPSWSPRAILHQKPLSFSMASSPRIT